MSVTKRGEAYYLTFRPLGGKLVYVKTSARSKAEAKQIEAAVLTAIRVNDYRALDVVAREACMRLFQNQRLEIPHTLSGEEPVQQELTLLEATRIFLRYPSIQDCKAKVRYGHCLANLIEKLGKDRPVKKLWVPDLRLYQSDRLSDGAKPATINWEMSTLSKLFGVLIELQMVESNPVHMVKRLKPGHREVYISAADVHTIMESSPSWYQPILQTAFFSGMRRGEIIGLTRKQVNLGTRIITLRPEDTKEAKSKRVPIHRELVPVLNHCMKVAAFGVDRVFTVQAEDGPREVNVEAMKSAWRRAVKKLNLDPAPHFHDLRHAWKTNARRSGMDPEIRESIMGHWFREKSVTERYGRVSDRELVEAIDRMTFDHGATEIYAVR